MEIIKKSYRNPRKSASQFLNPVSINLKELPQMPVSRFLKIVQETGQIPVCSFYLPVSTSRNHPVHTPYLLRLTFNEPQQEERQRLKTKDTQISGTNSPGV